MRVVVLGSGSKGNSTFIDTGEKKILIDVGFRFVHLKEKLDKIGVSPNDIDYLLKLNFTAPYILSKLVIPDMKENKWGRIINIGSIKFLIDVTNTLCCSA